MRYVVAAAIVALLLLGACSSGKVETSTSGPTGGAGPSGNGANAGADTGANAAGADTGAGNGAGSGSGGSAFDSIKNIMALKLKYTADYDFQSAGAPKMTQTWAFDLPRMAIKSNVGGAGESWTIVDGSKVVVCTKISAAWQCFTTASTEAPKNPSDSLSSSLDKQPTVTLAGSCSHAGESGTKYKVTSADYDSTVCYTSDGIMLETSTTASGQTMTMVATRVVRSVSQSDFTPPAEVTDMADFQKRMMAGAGLPSGVDIPTS